MLEPTFPCDPHSSRGNTVPIVLTGSGLSPSEFSIGKHTPGTSPYYCSKAALYASVQVIPYTLLWLRSEKYEQTALILLQVQMYQGFYLVSDDIVHRHGLGVTLNDALQDYEDALITYYESLVTHSEALSPALRRDLNELERRVKKHQKG